MIFDSNVVIDLIASGNAALIERLVELRQGRSLFANEIIFAEVATGFAQVEQVSGLFANLDITIAPLSLPECFRAGQAFAEYRRRGGSRAAILPDFLIGAQALVRGWPLVTRDRKGFASYFAGLEILDPTED